MKVELLGSCNQEELESRIQTVAAAGKLSRFKRNVFEVLESCNDYEKNLKLIKRIIGMGHKSIIEHDYLVFALCDVTPIIEQTIIGNRLTSFTVKSRREVDFRTVGYYVPEFRDENLEIHPKNKELKEKYQEHMKYLFNAYGEIVDSGVSVEDARFILPYSYHSNLIMGLDARELEKMITSLRSGRLSRIQELKELGDRLFEIAKEKVPYLTEMIENTNVNSENQFEYLEANSKRPEIKIIDRPRILSHTPNADDIIIKSNIMYHYQCSEQEAEKILKELEAKDEKAREKIMDNILHKDECRELEQVNFTLQIPISLSILTHLTRHRMHSLLIPEFVPLWNMENYITPATVEAGANEIYQEAARKNIEMFEYFKSEKIAQEDLIYFYIGAQMLNVVTTIDARNLKWILRLRCCNKAQWQIRKIAQDIAGQVKQIAPLLGKGVGATCMTDRYCGEGRECCGLIDKLLEADKKQQ